MSAQVIELMIFAVVAFFIINKLIATLGITSDDDPTKDPSKSRSSFFGENNIKDVTPPSKVSDILKKNLLTPLKSKPITSATNDLEEIIVKDNLESVLEGLDLLAKRMKGMNLSSFLINFLRNSKTAFQLIIEAYNNKQLSELEKLVDKRYLEQFSNMGDKYGDVEPNYILENKISEIYLFGNNVFIKVLFTGKNVLTRMKDLNEEWTFSRSLNDQGVDWFLTNINQA